MHRFLGFLGPPGRSYAPFLRGLGDRYMSVTSRFRGLGHLHCSWRGGQRFLSTPCLLCSRVVGRVLSPSISTTKCTQLLCLVSLVLVVPSHFPADPCRLMLGWAAGGCAVSRLSRRISFLRWGCPVVWVACTVSYPLWCKKHATFLNETVS